MAEILMQQMAQHSNIAVWGYTGGPSGSTNYAVYGSIAGFSGGNDFAGYFNGRTYVSSSLVVGTSETPSNASVTINSAGLCW